MTTVPSPTRLIVLRGNSASGKSSVAAGLRERYGRGIALVSQDTLRRDVLRERDVPGAANIGLIDLTVRHALEHGFHTVLEGILYVAHYGQCCCFTVLRVGGVGCGRLGRRCGWAVARCGVRLA